MPVLVSALSDEPVDHLRAFPLIATIAKLATASAQSVSQLSLWSRDSPPGLMMMDSELLDGLTGAGFRRASSLRHSALEVLSKIAIE